MQQCRVCGSIRAVMAGRGRGQHLMLRCCTVPYDAAVSTRGNIKPYLKPPPDLACLLQHCERLRFFFGFFFLLILDFSSGIFPADFSKIIAALTAPL